MRSSLQLIRSAPSSLAAPSSCVRRGFSGTRPCRRRGGEAIRPQAALGDAEAVWAILACSATAGQLLDRTRFGRLLSPPVTTMALTLALSATGVLPVESVVYDTVWSWLVPLSTALYLLDADLSLLFKAGRDALMGFLAGSVGTLAGLTAAWSALGHTGWLGPEGAKLCAALTASYVGGSVNFAAVSAALGVTHRPSMVAALAADNLVMAGYLAVLMVLPSPPYRPPGQDSSKGREEDDDAGAKSRSEMSEGAGGEGAGADALSILPCLSGALVSVWAGKVLASGIRRPEMSTALVSIVAVVIGATAARVRRAWHGGASTGANLKKRRPFSGSQSLGSALMGVFFASIGATAGSLDALRLAPGLLAFVFLQIAVHTVVCLGLGTAARVPLPALIIGSNANVGGPATAAAMAAARGWHALVEAGVLVGCLGYAMGTAVGLSCFPLLRT